MLSVTPGNLNRHNGVSIVRAHTHMPSDLNPDPRKKAAEYTGTVSAAFHLGPRPGSPDHDYFRCRESFSGSVSRIEDLA